MSGQQRSAAYRLIGYLMVIAASIMFGFNGNLSRIFETHVRLR